MIEEEDDEEILKKGITFKSFLKNLVLIILIVIGGLFIYLGGGTVMSWSIGFIFICIGATLIQVQKQTPEPIRQTLTILKCADCELTKVRNYEQRDFVFKKVGKCEKCQGLMEIMQIYSVRLKKPTESNKNSETKKEEALGIISE